MENNKPKCACSGIRSCLLCDPDSLSSSSKFNIEKLEKYIYCAKCKYRAFREDVYEEHINNHSSKEIMKKLKKYSVYIKGIHVETDVLTYQEESDLVQQIDLFDWVNSQSGRRKQDFGPKINFKKTKLKFDNFTGLPKLDVQILKKIQNERLIHHKYAHLFDETPDLPYQEINKNQTILNKFYPVEVCHLEYCPERGSSIDPHWDDMWIWGERLVTLNLLSSTVVTLTSPLIEDTEEDDEENFCIRINLPRRSMLVLWDYARHVMKHSIQRSDIIDRRIAITYRELENGFFCPYYSSLVEQFAKRCKNLITPKLRSLKNKEDKEEMTKQKT